MCGVRKKVENSDKDAISAASNEPNGNDGYKVHKRLGVIAACIEKVLDAGEEEKKEENGFTRNPITPMVRRLLSLTKIYTKQ